MKELRVAILGGSGYGGGELLRLLSAHPDLEVVAATSRKHAGKPVAAVHENLAGVTDLAFSGDDPEALATEVDALFFALPHGEAATRMRAVLDAAPDVAVVDLSGDFRLDTALEWEAAYGRTHPAPELVGEFLYGVPELNREAVRDARRIANPGCFATGAILALLPLAVAGRLRGPVALGGVTGSSGSGAEAKAGTHHPERALDYRAYRALSHQHVPEIAAALVRAGGAPELAMVPHSAPFVRGIFTTAWHFPATPLPVEELRAIYEERYAGERFVRMRAETPRVGVVNGSNCCDVAVHGSADGRQVVVMSAIDNLVKGMAGQAVQNLNLVLDLPEDAGLGHPGSHP